MDMFSVVQSSRSMFESSRNGALAILLIPVILLFLLGSLLMHIAGFAFGIQALVVGSHLNLEGPFACDHINTLHVWFIVFGVFEVASFVLGCCKSTANSTKDKEGGDKKQVTFGCGGITSLFSLFLFGWLCYGMHLVRNPPGYLPTCVPSEWDIFSLAVKFNLYGIILFHLLVVGLMCSTGCCVSGVSLSEARKGGGAWTVSLV